VWRGRAYSMAQLAKHLDVDIDVIVEQIREGTFKE
jgi:hypothetical protein